MRFTEGDQVWVVNSYRTRATVGHVREVTDVDVEVWNEDKQELQYFHPVSGEALGDYWDAASARPEVVEWGNTETTQLGLETSLRTAQQAAQQAVKTYAVERTDGALTRLEMAVNYLRLAVDRVNKQE